MCTHVLCVCVCVCACMCVVCCVYVLGGVHVCVFVCVVCVCVCMGECMCVCWHVCVCVFVAYTHHKFPAVSYTLSSGKPHELGSAEPTKEEDRGRKGGRRRMEGGWEEWRAEQDGKKDEENY